MAENTQCNLCGSERGEVLLRSADDNNRQMPNLTYTITDGRPPRPTRILRCLDCGLIYASSPLNAADLRTMYANMKDETYLSEEKGRRLSARIMLKRLMRYKKSGRLLDIGCATGLFLDEAKKLGWQTSGIELSHWAASIARDRFKLEVFTDRLEDVRYPDFYFDAVIMSDTIEHLDDPRGTLAEAARILKSDGILCVSTPDIESIVSRLLKARWWGINVAHIFYFSRQSLKAMLAATGFEAIAFYSHVRIFSPAYLTLRLNNYAPRLAALLSKAANIIFPQNKLITVNLGDQIEVYARKKQSIGSTNKLSKLD